MANYEDFAYVYDTFMDQIPYEKWCQNIVNTLEKHNIKDGLVLDLCCGTGVLTRMLRDRGYDMIGADLSEDMLEVAREKEYESDEEAGEKGQILYLQQDMREFELYGTVAAVVCACDSINYLLEDNEVIRTFSLVNNYLDPGGIFIFDFNTPEKYAAIGDATIAENREDCSFIWENYYDSFSHKNEYDLTLFTECEDGLFKRAVESHVQRGYTEEEMRNYIKAAGLKLEGIEKLEDGRIVAVCKEKDKNKEKEKK